MDLAQEIQDCKEQDFQIDLRKMETENYMWEIQVSVGSVVAGARIWMLGTGILLAPSPMVG